MLNETEDIPFLARVMFNNKDCYDKFVDGDIFDGPCLQLISSKLISYVIIAVTSFFVKMPQVVKIYRAKSGRGINMYSQIMNVAINIMGISYSLARGFPLSIWGEMLILGVQQMAIVFLMLWYNNRKQVAALFLVVYAAILVLFMSPWIPMSFHVMLQMTNIPISTSSKLIQLWTNWTNRSTGQLSAMTVTMQGLRCMGRCYSNIIETGDLLRIGLYVEASLLNGAILSQIMYYGYVRKDEKKKTS